MLVSTCPARRCQILADRDCGFGGHWLAVDSEAGLAGHTGVAENADTEPGASERCRILSDNQTSRNCSITHRCVFGICDFQRRPGFSGAGCGNFRPAIHGGSAPCYALRFFAAPSRGKGWHQ